MSMDMITLLNSSAPNAITTNSEISVNFFITCLMFEELSALLTLEIYKITSSAYVFDVTALSHVTSIECLLIP